MAFSTTLGFVFLFFVNRVSSLFFVKGVNISDQCLFDIILIPFVLLIFSLGAYDFLGSGQMVLDDMISVIGIIHPVNYRISSIF